MALLGPVRSKWFSVSGDFARQGTLSGVGDSFGCHAGVGCSWNPTRRARVLLNTLHRAAPTTLSRLAHNANGAGLSNSTRMEIKGVCVCVSAGAP